MTHKKNTPRYQSLIRRKDNNDPVADETVQAFSGPLFDQNGNLVRYEVIMNEVEYDYVVENKFYNLDEFRRSSLSH